VLQDYEDKIQQAIGERILIKEGEETKEKGIKKGGGKSW
jgi:hypothetical protein